MRIKENFNKKLLVEGNDDQHVIWSLCSKFDLKENFDVIDCEGISNLLDQLPIRFKQSNIETIGVIVDADVNLNKRWESLVSPLKQAGFNIPEELPDHGLVIKNNDGKTVGVWIMPNNNLNGMLEDFINFLIPSEDKLLPIIKNNLEYLENNALNQYKLLHKSKALIHSWLSIQEDPGTPMGLAITKKFLTTEQDICHMFINWLKELYT